MRMAKAVASDRRDPVRPRAVAAPSVRRHGLLPAFHKALALLLDQLGNQGHRLLRPRRRNCADVAQAAWSPVARLRAARASSKARPGPVRPAPGRSSLQSRCLRPARCDRRITSATLKAAAWGSHDLHAVLCRVEALQHTWRRIGNGRLSGALDRGAHFDLAALEPGDQQVAQRGLELARSSSGSRNDRSRKRLLTERISSPRRRRGAGSGLGFVIPALAVLCWALA